ncbi:MAG: AAA family ATPase [Hyphomicrobiales bacterium]|nr:AAA family ATPase [Hyphomicrobiales bacterium]
MDDLEPKSTSATDQPALIMPVPRISMQAFCETPDVASLISDAASDRRMDKAHVKVHMGGASAAIEAYRTAPTPNLIVLEAGGDRAKLHADLDELAQFCDAGTKVVVIGRTNDISLYRELMSRGISEYMVTPFSVLDFVRHISQLYNGDGAAPLGRMLAFVGAKGGVGASTVAHNVAWSIARELEIQTVIADMDIAYGTAGLDFNQDPPQGIADAVLAPDRLDANMIDRLLSKCTDHLSLLAASATLERTYDFEENAFDMIFDILRATIPCIVLDVPHTWNAWSKRVLTGADDVVVVASPDLANLRNTKGLLDVLRAARPNDHKPKLVLNNVGMLKRPEIELSDFAAAVEADPIGVIPFDAKLFGTATNNGQMIGEVEAASKTAEILAEIGRTMMGRAEVKKAKKTLPLLDPIMSRFIKRKAS